MAQTTTRIRYKKLSREEELQCIKKAKEGDLKAQSTLIKSFGRYSRKIAYKYMLWLDNKEALEDLYQEGCLGILHAAKAYDLNSTVPFLGYATWWIRQYIQKWIKYNSRTIRTPGITFTSERAPRLDKALEMTQTIPYSSAPRKEDIVSNTLASNNPDPLDSFVESEQESVLLEVVKTLPPAWQMIIITYYGLCGVSPRNLREIASARGVTPQAISSQLTQAKARIKKELATTFYSRLDPDIQNKLLEVGA